jgi:hypothetical protein
VGEIKVILLRASLSFTSIPLMHSVLGTVHKSEHFQRLVTRNDTLYLVWKKNLSTTNCSASHLLPRLCLPKTSPFHSTFSPNLPLLPPTSSDLETLYLDFILSLFISSYCIKIPFLNSSFLCGTTCFWSASGP